MIEKMTTIIQSDIAGGVAGGALGGAISVMNPLMITWTQAGDLALSALIFSVVGSVIGFFIAKCLTKMTRHEK